MLCYGGLCGEFAGLVDTGVKARILYDRGGAPEPPDVADFGDDLGPVAVETLGMVVMLGSISVSRRSETPPRDHCLDLEGGGVLAEPDPRRRLRRGLDLGGPLGPEPACEPSESILAIEDLRLRNASDGVGHSASTLSDADPNMSEGSPAHSGKWASSA